MDQLHTLNVLLVICKLNCMKAMQMQQTNRTVSPQTLQSFVHGHCAGLEISSPQALTATRAHEVGQVWTDTINY